MLYNEVKHHNSQEKRDDMSRFDDILDDVIDKARYAADIAGKKTTEMVEYGKIKYKAKTVAWDIEKAYSKLGQLVYEAKKSGEGYDEPVALAVEEIDRLNAQLDELEDQLSQMKTDNAKSARVPKADEAPEAEERTGEIFNYPGEQ
jgi:uncharacterized protein Yka (UPF0111/DUF47 family)